MGFILSSLISSNTPQVFLLLFLQQIRQKLSPESVLAHAKTVQNVLRDIIDKFEKKLLKRVRFLDLRTLVFEPPSQASTQGERHWKLEE